MHVRPLAALASAILPMALLVWAPTAHADDSTTGDVPRDVIRFNVMTENARLLPANKKFDVTRFTTKYGNGRLKMTTKVRELAQDHYDAVWRVRAGGEDSFFVVSPDQPARLRSVSAAGGRWTGARAARGVECPDARAVLDRRRDTATAYIPRSCLGGAPSVRTGAAFGFEGERYFFVDDARRDASYQGAVKLGDKRIDYN